MPTAGGGGPLDGELTMLDGNQVGALLADYALSLYGSAATPARLNSVVSSRSSGCWRLPADAHYERTLTGFKWLWSAALELERHGVGPSLLRLRGALAIRYFRQFATKTASRPGERSRSYPQRSRSWRKPVRTFVQLYAEHGLWASAAHSLRSRQRRKRSARSLSRCMPGQGQLRVAGERVLRIIDYRVGASAAAIVLGATAAIRPSSSSAAASSLDRAAPSQAEAVRSLRHDVTRGVILRATN